MTRLSCRLAIPCGAEGFPGLIFHALEICLTECQAIHSDQAKCSSTRLAPKRALRPGIPRHDRANREGSENADAAASRRFHLAFRRVQILRLLLSPAPHSIHVRFPASG